MRTYENDNVETGRPRADRIVDEATEPLGRAAADGRLDVLGASGLLALQRSAGNAGVSSMMSDESDVRSVVSSGGSPLDAGVRADMEQRFGQDFGDVRVHSGGDAHASAAKLSAQAYTVGSDIVFQEGRYDPGSAEGSHMLAHELTHVVQQRNGAVDGTDIGGGVRVSHPSDAYERAASVNADHIMSMSSWAAASPVNVGPTGGGVSVQRDGDEELEAQTYVQRATEEEPEEQTEA